MDKFKSHKIVEAAKIIGFKKFHQNEPVDPRGINLLFAGDESVGVSDKWVDKNSNGKGPKALIDGYFVEYPDGYQSWSPADSFESGYSQLNEGEAQEQINPNVDDIKGYRRLNEDEISLINAIKVAGGNLGAMVASLEGVESLDQRWVEIAKTDLQKGFMGLVRAVAQPGGF